MVVKSNLNRKIIFVIVFLEIRDSFLKNLILGSGIKRVTRNSPTFFSVIQEQETTKTINYNFFASPGKLQRYCKQE